MREIDGDLGLVDIFVDLVLALEHCLFYDLGFLPDGDCLPTQLMKGKHVAKRD